MQTRARFGVVLLLAAVEFVAGGCRQSLSPEQEREFQDAVEAELGAGSPAEFLAAAAAYQDLRDRGVHSAELLFNQGNAYLRGGQRGRAIACFRAALRFRPRSAEIRHNLHQALGGEATKQAPSLRAMLDPAQWLALDERALLGAGLVVLAALLGSLRVLWSWRATTWPAMVALLAGLLLLASGAQQYRQAAARLDAIVVQTTPLRAGPSLGFEPQTDNTLTEGQAVAVLQEQQRWRQVITGDGRSGWLTDADLEFY